MKKHALLLMLTVSLTTFACGDKEPSTGGPIQENNVNPEPDMPTPDAGDAEIPDVAPPPPDMPPMVDDVVEMGPPENPGVMHGQWQVSRETGEYVATLNLRHEEAMTTVTGTYTMDEPASTGPIGGSQFVNDSFSAQWAVEIEGSNETWVLNSCKFADATMATMNGCFLSISLEGNVVNAVLTKQ